MYNYFCNCCGKRFENPLPEKDEKGFNNSIMCPECGAYDVYPNTEEGARQSIIDDGFYFKNDIRQLRSKYGLTQRALSDITGIPKRTIEEWEAGRRNPPKWVYNLLTSRLSYLNNWSVKKYAEICRNFAHDTKNLETLSTYHFYTTNSTSWEKTCDNAHGGIDVSWAFHLSDAEIDSRAAEILFENLKDLISQAIDEGWDAEQLKGIVETFSF